MGVKYLWSVLEPTCDERPVSELFGKRVAVDTSCWVVSDHHVIPSHVIKPHLRNLFFRTASLLSNGIEPVYVLEGKAPELKAQTMKKRREAQYSQTKPSETTDTSRSRYNYIQKECKELLNALGITTITSFGEAEAGCAALNQMDLVDGCITVDGDAFLYGAKKVYRNLSTDLSNFVCQEFTSSKIESSLNLSRDKLIVLAIIFGCDYLPEGLNSVNRDCVIQLLSSWPKGQAINNLKDWLKTEIPDEATPSRPPHCSVCKHPGSLRNHSKSGCTYCGSASECVKSNNPCKCQWHKNELSYEERNIRRKLRSVSSVDVLKIVEEFQKEPPEQWKGLSIHPWRMPHVSDFVKIVTKKLKWESNYAVNKVLPLLTRWIAIHGRKATNEGSDLKVVPVRVIKKRVKRGCPMYEVEWKLDEAIDGFPTEFISLEPQFLIEQNYEGLLCKSPSKPIRIKKSRKKKNADEGVRSNDIAEMLAKMTLTKKTNSKQEPSKSKPCNQSISLEESEDSDLSDIVDIICSRRNPGSHDTVSHRLSPSTQQQKVVHISPVNRERLNGDSEIGTCANNGDKPNFTFNFSISELLKDKTLSISEDNYIGEFSSNPLENSVSFRVEDDHLEALVSTPPKNSFDSDFEADSFATPQPLAKRFYSSESLADDQFD